MASSRKYAQVRSVSMYSDQWAKVDAYAQEKEDKNSSAALRRIVDEWSRLKSDGAGSVHAILSGYLAGQVTAEEAMQALTMHRELMPAP